MTFDCKSSSRNTSYSPLPRLMSWGLYTIKAALSPRCASQLRFSTMPIQYLVHKRHRRLHQQRPRASPSPQFQNLHILAAERERQPGVPDHAFLAREQFPIAGCGQAGEVDGCGSTVGGVVEDGQVFLAKTLQVDARFAA